MSLTIVCSGSLLRMPLGGMTWHHLQYVVGLRRMGHRVVYVEHFGWPRSCYDPTIDRMTSDAGYGLAYVRPLLERFGISEWCYLAEDGQVHGMPRNDLLDALRQSDLQLNLSGSNWFDELALCRRRVLIDTDPVFTQIGAHGLSGAMERHQVLFTYALNVGGEGCTMPTAGHRWLTTRQPVVMGLWPVTPADAGAAFTTVMSWSAYGPRAHEGRTYGQKDVQFRAVIDLPRASGMRLEVAVGAPPQVRAELAAAGWAVREATAVSLDPWQYQQYLQRSRGEFSVAKHAYVTTRSGWFSDRACGYLASARPAVIEDTGIGRHVPTGDGLLTFSDLPGAIEAMSRIEADYAHHCRAARKIAETHFAAERVLGELLEQCL